MELVGKMESDVERISRNMHAAKITKGSTYTRTILRDKKEAFAELASIETAIAPCRCQTVMRRTIGHAPNESRIP
jgi:hypothetical protein